MKAADNVSKHDSIIQILYYHLFIGPILNYSSQVTTMVKSVANKSRTSSHSFKIVGSPQRYIKDEVEVSFKPLPKK